MDYEPMLPVPKGAPRQLEITGDDWRSERDKKAQVKAEAARKKAAIACARKLEAASAALSEYLLACIDCRDASKSRGEDDSRLILMRNIDEYAGHLSTTYGKP